MVAASVVYVDDTTLTCSDKSSEDLTKKLTIKYEKIATFMRDNKLKLNDDKLHLIVIDTSCSKIKYEESRKVRIYTSNAVIEPSKTEKLLGCWVHDSLKWSEHLTNASENMVKSLNTRLGALKKICRLTTFRNRKMLANGLFISKLTYLICL